MKSSLKKVAELAAGEPATKDVPKEPPAEKEPESPADKLKESTQQEMPEILSEVTKTPSRKSIDIHQVMSEKKLIPPRRQVAEIIDRLQEIEGTKPESPLTPIDLDILPSANETKRGILDDGKGDKRNDKKRKTKQTRVMIADQDDGKSAPSDSTKTGKVARYNSESEISVMSFRDSEMTMRKKQIDEIKGCVREVVIIPGKAKHDVKTVEQSQETDSTHQPQAETQT